MKGGVQVVLASREGSSWDWKGCGRSPDSDHCVPTRLCSHWELVPGDGVSGHHEHPRHPLWQVCQDAQGRWAPKQPPVTKSKEQVSAGVGIPSVGPDVWVLGC